MKSKRSTDLARVPGRAIGMCSRSVGMKATDVKLAFGGIVEDMECNLVSEPAPGDELLRGDPRQDLVETLVKGIGHGDVSRQCRT